MVELVDLLKKLLQAWDKFTDWISTGLGFLSSWFSGLIDALTQALDAFWEELSNAFTDVWNLAEDAFEKAKAAGVAAAAAFSNAVVEAWNYAQDALAEAESYTDALVDSLEYVTQEFVTSLVAGVQSIADDAQVLAGSAVAGVDYLAGVIDDIIINFDLWVETSLVWLLNFWIETEAESEKYKIEGVE